MTTSITRAITALSAEVYFAFACGALLGTGAGIERWWPSIPGWVPLAMYVSAYVFGGAFTVRDASIAGRSGASKSTA